MDIVNHKEQEEYRQVRRDLIFTVTLNILFLALLIGLFFYNRVNGQVDQFFAQILKF